MIWIQQYVRVILGAVIVLLLIFGAVQTVRLNLAVAAKATALAEKAVVQAQLQTQLNNAQELQRQGEELVDRVRYNQNQAAENNKKLMKALNELEVTIVPEECEEAVKWAGKSASSLSQGW